MTSDPNKLKFSDLGFGFLNNCSDQGAGNSVDRRRSNGTDYLKAAIQKTYQPSAMSGVGNTMTGIVMHCSQKKPGAARTKEDILSAYARTGLQRAWDKVKSWTSDGLINVYKVYIPEIECRPAPLSFEDPVVFTYYDVYQATGLDAKDPIPLGSVVHVEFENLVNFKNPTIVWCSKEPVAFEGETGNGSGPARNGGSGGGSPSPGGTYRSSPGTPGNPPHNSDKCYGIDETTAVPQADRLRAALIPLGYGEKGRELSNGGDLDANLVNLMISLLKQIKKEMPNLQIRLTGGNDCFHQHRVKKYGKGVTRHARGSAMDMTIYPANTATLDKVVSILMRYSGANERNVRFIDEYRRPTGHATGGHFHVSWGLGTEGAAVMKHATKQVEAGKIEPLTV